MDEYIVKYAAVPVLRYCYCPQPAGFKIISYVASRVYTIASQETHDCVVVPFYDVSDDHVFGMSRPVRQYPAYNCFTGQYMNGVIVDQIFDNEASAKAHAEKLRLNLGPHTAPQREHFEKLEEKILSLP